MNSKIVSEPTGEQMTLFSPVGSLNYANPTHLQESDLEKKMTVISGRKCLDAFGRLSRAGSWAKTFSELLLGTGDWYSTRCRLTWKLKGTKYKRLYFQLAPSMLHTEGIGFGLLLTPTTHEEVQDLEKFKERMEKYPNGTTMPNLATQVVGLLPTPRATKISGTDREDFSPSLPGLMNKGMLPTPKTQNSRHALKDRGKSNLGEEMSQWGQDNGIGSQLNPPFVAEMMGFPPNWTELPFLNGETNPSKPTETP